VRINANDGNGGGSSNVALPTSYHQLLVISKNSKKIMNTYNLSNPYLLTVE